MTTAGTGINDARIVGRDDAGKYVNHLPAWRLLPAGRAGRVLKVPVDVRATATQPVRHGPIPGPAKIIGGAVE